MLTDLDIFPFTISRPSNQARAALPENDHVKDVKIEFQVRTLLQHAWAEIEHDFGYKTEVAVPREMRRRFCRLAGPA